MPQFLEHSGASWKGQRLKHKTTGMDSLDPRCRILVTVGFSVVVVFSHQYLTLVSALILALVCAFLTKLDVKRTLRRMLAMDLFMLFLLVMLPFTTPGPTWFELWGLSASIEGFQRAIQIILKANAAILLLLTLVGTLEATTLGYALARLKVPVKLVHLLLFTVRYLEVINREYKTMRSAMKARAFRPGSNRHTWSTFGYLLGMLLVRSLERSERILAAMKCRGFKGQFYLLDSMFITPKDKVFTVVSSLCLLALITMELLT